MCGGRITLYQYKPFARNIWKPLDIISLEGITRYRHQIVVFIRKKGKLTDLIYYIFV